MFDIGLGELAVIAFIAVLVFGPDKLPELAKQAGRFLHRAKTFAFVAVLVFGPDRLPDCARQAGRMARQVRSFAHAARDELRTELGPAYSNLELRDLDPRTIVRKHVIEAMEDAEAEASTQRGLRPLAAGEIPPYDVEAT